MNSWKTTAGGFITGIILCLMEIADALGIILTNPNTHEPLTNGAFDFQLFMAGIAAFGIGWAARDNDKTSEEVGASKKAASRRSAASKIPMFACICALFFLPGCGILNPASSQTFIDANQVRSSGNPGSILDLTEDGRMRANFQGVGPSATNQDELGTYSMMPGPVGLITFNQATGNLYAASPKDMRMVGVKFTPQPKPGEPSFSADLIEANLSPVVSVYDRMLTSSMDAIKDMTQTEATKQIESMKAAGDITAAIADVLLQSVVPHLPAQ